MAGARITARADDGSEVSVEVWSEQTYPDELDDCAAVCGRLWERMQVEAEADG